MDHSAGRVRRKGKRDEGSCRVLLVIALVNRVGGLLTDVGRVVPLSRDLYPKRAVLVYVDVRDLDLNATDRSRLRYREGVSVLVKVRAAGTRVDVVPILDARPLEERVLGHGLLKVLGLGPAVDELVVERPVVVSAYRLNRVCVADSSRRYRLDRTGLPGVCGRRLLGARRLREYLVLVGIRTVDEVLDDRIGSVRPALDRAHDLSVVAGPGRLRRDIGAIERLAVEDDPRVRGLREEVVNGLLDTASGAPLRKPPDPDRLRDAIAGLRVNSVPLRYDLESPLVAGSKGVDPILGRLRDVVYCGIACHPRISKISPADMIPQAVCSGQGHHVISESSN